MGLGEEGPRSSRGLNPTESLEFEALGVLGAWAPEGPYRPLGSLDMFYFTFFSLFLMCTYAHVTCVHFFYFSTVNLIGSRISKLILVLILLFSTEKMALLPQPSSPCFPAN